jgi:DNA polymerase III alpha subunit
MAGTNGPTNGAVVPLFAHLDVQSAYSAGAGPSSPDDFVRALVRQYPLDASSDQAPKLAIALADTGLHSAVKMAVACAREGVEHVIGLRVRVVSTRVYRAWGEQPGELVLLAQDEVGWLNLVALNNLGHLAGSDRTGPRIDWQDLAAHADGL